MRMLAMNSVTWMLGLQDTGPLEESPHRTQLSRDSGWDLGTLRKQRGQASAKKQ